MFYAPFVSTFVHVFRCKTAMAFEMEIRLLIWLYTSLLRVYTRLFGGHVRQMKYLVNIDISAMRLFHLL